MLDERRIRTRTPEWRTIIGRIQVAMELTSRLNALPFSDVDGRNALRTVAPIVIEADVWIGAAATALPGVTIGRGSVVGAGSVVPKDVLR